MPWFNAIGSEIIMLIAFISTSGKVFWSAFSPFSYSFAMLGQQLAYIVSVR